MACLNQKEWVKKWAPFAEQVTSNTNIFPEIILAVAILESQKEINGRYCPAQSGLAKKANNLFGIKDSRSWEGPTVTMKTKEYLGPFPIPSFEKFRKYPNKEASFRDFINLMKINRYRPVRQAKTIDTQAEALAKSGYATDPNYQGKLTLVARVVQKYIEDLESQPAIKKDGNSLVVIAGIGLTLFLINQNS